MDLQFTQSVNPLFSIPYYYFGGMGKELLLRYTCIWKHWQHVKLHLSTHFPQDVCLNKCHPNVWIKWDEDWCFMSVFSCHKNFKINEVHWQKIKYIMIIYNDILLVTNILLKESNFLGFNPYHQSNSLINNFYLDISIHSFSCNLVFVVWKHQPKGIWRHGMFLSLICCILLSREANTGTQYRSMKQ